MRVEGSLTVLTEEQSRSGKGSQQQQKTSEIEELGKMNIFKKAQDKNENVMKSKGNWNDYIDPGKE